MKIIKQGKPINKEPARWYLIQTLTCEHCEAVFRIEADDKHMVKSHRDDMGLFDCPCCKKVTRCDRRTQRGKP